MTEITIIPATLEHARMIAPRMIVPEISDIWTKMGRTPLDSAEYAVRKSPYAWAGFADGEIGALFGVGADSLLSDKGMPWLLTTPVIYQHRIAFLRRSRDALCGMKELFSELEGFIDPRHKLSVLWLRWLGFAIDEPKLVEEFGIPFRRFEMKTNG